MTTTPALPDALGDIEFDPEDLTLDEVEELEQLLGTGLDSLLEGHGPKAPALKAIMFVLARRDNPDVTLADVGKLKLKAIGLSMTSDAAAGEGDAPEG